MPTLRNARHEKYCMAVARGETGTAAAREAGFAHPGQAAGKLLRLATVRGRIAELRAVTEEAKLKQLSKLAGDFAPSRQWVLQELCEQVGLAKEAHDRGATLKGLELVGKELGMFVQRTMAIESPLQRLPAEKLLRLLALVEEAVDYREPIVKPANDAVIIPPMIEHDALEAAEGEG